MIYGAMMDGGVDYLLITADTEEIATQKAQDVAKARGWQFDGLVPAEELIKDEFRGVTVLSNL